MATYRCEKCHKQYKKIVDAQKCCGLDKLPCLSCQAKNFCGNKDPKNPMRDNSTMGIKVGDDLWGTRGCK